MHGFLKCYIFLDAFYFLSRSGGIPLHVPVHVTGPYAGRGQAPPLLKFGVVLTDFRGIFRGNPKIIALGIESTQIFFSHFKLHHKERHLIFAISELILAPPHQRLRTGLA